VDPCLYEAATIDGANKWHKIIHIDIPTLIPTIIILFILSFGRLMTLGFEKVFLLQNSQNLETSEVITTYVYKQGIRSAQYSFSAAVDLFNTTINFILLLSMNYISGKLSKTSLF